MATGPGFPSSTNAFIPTYGRNSDVDGRLIVGFSRNVRKFALPGYVQYVPITQPLGYYLKLTNQEGSRYVNSQDWIWPDGQNRPQRNRDLESFNFIPFRTERYDYGFSIGQRTVRSASWPMVEVHAGLKAQQLMTARTQRLWTVLTTAANWGTAADPDLTVNHTSATATALGAGGSIYAGTSTDPRFKRALNLMALKITLDTAGNVGDDPSNFNVILNPNTASALALGAELHDYLKGSPDALDEIKTGQSPNAMYGLPSNCYGYKIWTEKTVKVTARVGGTLARSFVVPDNAMVFMSRPGGLDGVYGAPSFSTASIFTLEELTVETREDSWNRLTEGACVEDVSEALTCPASGWYLADASA